MATLTNEQNKSVNEIMELERETCRCFQARDIDSMIDALMENAIVCPPGYEAIIGKENQRMLFKEIAKLEGFQMSWEPIEAHVSSSDDMAYVYGLVTWKMPNEPEQKGKYISVWTKVNGQWKNAVEIRNSNS